MAPEAILLDFDGTLVDTAPDFIAALNRLLGELERPPVTFEEFRSLAGDGAKRLLERALVRHGTVPPEPEHPNRCPPLFLVYETSSPLSLGCEVYTGTLRALEALDLESTAYGSTH